MARHNMQYANSNEQAQLLQPNPEENCVKAFLDCCGDNGSINPIKLSEFVRNYYVNSLKTREFCAAIIEEEHQHHREALCVQFFWDVACVNAKHSSMWEGLRLLRNIFDEKIDRINDRKSAVLFTGAAEIAAAFAAAAIVAAVANDNPKTPAVAAATALAFIVLAALGNRANSVLNLKERESGLKKHKEIISVMTMWNRFGKRDVVNILELVHRLHHDVVSISSEKNEVNARKKLAALQTSIEELQMEDSLYSRDMRCATKLVLQSISKNLD